MVDRNELLGHAFELGSLIADSPEVEEYKRTKDTMESHPQIKPLLAKLREMQQEYEKLQAYSRGPHLKGLEDSISETLAKLDEFPEVVAFKQSSAKVDELLQSVTTLLTNCITGKVNGVPLPRPPKGGG
ncbi:YlbF family regulator [Effusibacillus consociatus]|uniref:YlbF family regulator n=1 Tax=Effusibacillus consociatus TaxID=1117041 RepID=A0ABV9Q5X5_9BACL